MTREIFVAVTLFLTSIPAFADFTFKLCQLVDRSAYSCFQKYEDTRISVRHAQNAEDLVKQVLPWDAFNAIILPNHKVLAFDFIDARLQFNEIPNPAGQGSIIPLIQNQSDILYQLLGNVFFEVHHKIESTPRKVLKPASIDTLNFSVLFKEDDINLDEIQRIVQNPCYDWSHYNFDVLVKNQDKRSFIYLILFGHDWSKNYADLAKSMFTSLEGVISFISQMIYARNHPQVRTLLKHSYDKGAKQYIEWFNSHHQGTIEVVQLKHSLLMYHYHREMESDKFLDSDFGYWLSRIPLSSSEEVHSKNAIRKDWGGTVNYRSKVLVPENTFMVRSYTRPHESNHEASEEQFFFFRKINEKNGDLQVIETSPLDRL